VNEVNGYWSWIRVLGLAALIVAVVTPVFLAAFVVYGYVSGRWAWGGTEFDGASLWDWLELLIVPVVLAFVGFLLNAAQRARDERAQRELVRQAQEYEYYRQREQAERAMELEQQREIENVLREYFNEMYPLIRDGLASASSDSPSATVAQLNTQRVLARIGSPHKREVLHYLHTSRLIQKDDAVIRLDGTDLSYALLNNSDLSNADLRDVNLSSSNLERADLSGADLSSSNLERADLSGVILRDADLSGANLEGVKGISSEELEHQGVALLSTTMPDGRVHD